MNTSTRLKTPSKALNGEAFLLTNPSHDDSHIIPQQLGGEVLNTLLHGGTEHDHLARGTSCRTSDKQSEQSKAKPQKEGETYYW